MAAGRLARALVGAATAAAATVAVRAVAARRAPGGAERWERVNHRGEPVSMLEGPAVAAGLTVGAVAALPGRLGTAAAVATTGGAAFGIVDDLAEDTSRRTKGLRGHLGALAHGELTTGGLKVLGIGATAFVAACARGPRGTEGPGVRGFDVLVDTALVAGTANLLNLLDLRPGRALKAAAGAAVLLAPLAPSTASAAGPVLGAAAAAASRDLAERDMLGDGGANALGALVGVQATALPRAVRVAALAGVVGLTVASERVSFSAVIDRTPALRTLDRLGRRG
jgi:UDP-N-acetylmuramyl pentapeptide phosphotransferase/UDP-N-acetylglucosamine-1-phosphate transferase